MPRLRLALFFLASLMLTTACMHDRTPLPHWMRATASATYAEPDAFDRARLSAALARSLGEGDHGAWAPLPYQLTSRDGHVAVRELAPAFRGWGAYAFRDTGGRPLLIQAPHADSDLHSGEIGYALYRHARARAFALNTAHRSRAGAGADQANAEESPFVLMAREAVRLDPATVVVQVHGFGEASARRHELDVDTLVISNGSREPDAALLGLAGCLGDAGIDARVFPTGAAYPGGTRNTTGAALRELGAGRFVHLEFGPGLRKRLLEDDQLSGSIAGCL